MYVETNFILGYATARSGNFDILLNQAARLAIPDICFMEAITTEISAYDKVRADFRLRLYNALDVLRSRAVVVPSSKAWFADFEHRGSLIADPTDEAIHAAIRDHARMSFGTRTLFFSEDKGYAKSSVRTSLESVGVHFTTSIDEVMTYLTKERT